MQYHKLIPSLVKANFISDTHLDKKCASFIFTLLSKGPRHIHKCRDKDYKLWMKNLTKSKYFTRTGKIKLDHDFEGNEMIKIALMMLVAQGLMVRK